MSNSHSVVGSKSIYALLAAELYGTLADASQAKRNGRAPFFAFQNALRNLIRPTGKRVLFLVCPAHHPMVTRRVSNAHPPSNGLTHLIWKTKSQLNWSTPIMTYLCQLHLILAETSRNRSIGIGHAAINRDAQFTSLGDTSGTGDGAYCHKLQYWFDILWSTKTQIQFHLHVHIKQHP